MSDKIPELFGAWHKDPNLVSSHPETKKLMCIDMAKSKEEKQGLPVEATQQKGL